MRLGLLNINDFHFAKSGLCWFICQGEGPRFYSSSSLSYLFSVCSVVNSSVFGLILKLIRCAHPADYMPAISGSIILTKACEVFSFQGFSQRRRKHGGLSIFRQKFVGESPSSALWRLSMTAGVPARYTPDSANSAWEVFFKFDELFQFLAAHTNAS